jgi:hypothetical protein
VRSGVAILIVPLVALIAIAPAGADTPADTNTLATTTTTTDTTTAPPATTTTTTPTPATTTTTAPPTTTTTPATTTRPAPVQKVRRPSAATHYAAAAATALAGRCASSGAAAILAPGRTPLAVGAAPAHLGPALYRAVVGFRAATAGGASCGRGTVTIRSLSLFGGAVTADTLVARAGAGTIADLRVAGLAVSLPPGSSLAIGSWGEVETGARAGGIAAPLAVRLLRSHSGLPAGTIVLVGYAGKPTGLLTGKKRARHLLPREARRRRHRHRPRPLEVTPPLGQSGYLFPVSGGAGYADTYGANRSDIRDGWHHGDDLFAPLGAPVIAVADGTLSLVGWEKLGGWRLWLTDARGNQFYYAHLAGYSPQALHHRRVHAGEVLGFLGRTGDAFTTEPHLHFEIHPVGLLRLGYDGAVDPTTYLRDWHVVQARQVPRPALPRRVPAGVPGHEARVVWAELVAARGLSASKPAPATLAPRHALVPDDIVFAPAGTAAAAPAIEASAAQRPAATGPPLLLAFALGLAAAGAAAVSTLLLRRRGPRRPALLPAPTRDDDGCYRLSRPQ